MTLDDLYRDLGRLIIQQEIVQAQLNQVKSQIAQELNKAQELLNKPEPNKV